ncbi:MAG: DUF4097 family beta strand repeat-containing protein [Spirochaetia bacterium]
MKFAAIMIALVTLAAGPAFSSGEEENGSFTISGIDSVIVNAGPLDVQVNAGNRFSVSVRADLPRDFLFDSRGYRVVRQRSGSRLSIQVRSDSPFGMTGAGRLLLEVPRETRLRAESSSGRVAVDGIEGDTCSIRTVSGRVTVRNVRAGLTVDTVSGDVSIDSFEGGLNAKTVSGSIKGRGIAFTEDSAFSTVSGNVDIRVDSSLDDIRFDLSSVSGPLVVGGISAQRGLRMGFGDVSIRAHTVSGSLIFQ